MSAISSKSLETRNSLLRSIALGGLFIFIAQLVIQSWFVASILQQNPFIVVLQYIASGAIGVSAFEGGIGAALLGVLFHLVISFVIAAVFILSADRLPLLRRHVIAGALLYGFGVWIVMHLIVAPLSAAPPVPPPTAPYLIAEIIEHILVVGLPLGILVQRNANTNQ
jgi:uncharacterized membrane protein YagU involved in acid resistance